MKKIAFIMFLILPFSLSAQSLDTRREIESYGMMAGLAYVCGMHQEIKNYEVIITDLIYNKSQNSMEEKDLKGTYVAAKKKFYQAHFKNPEINCGEIRAGFLSQGIFMFKKNHDGSMIAPNGALIKKPR